MAGFPNPPKPPKEQCISLPKAQHELGVSRSTLANYIRDLCIMTHTFVRDRKVYISREDFELIRYTIESNRMP
jgi:hypothetical protein